MRGLRAGLIVAAAGAAAACHPKPLGHSAGIGDAHRPLTVGRTLICPGEVGALTRTAQASDGRSCAYDGPRQEQVQLSFMPLDEAGPEAKLAGLERTLRMQLPSAIATADNGAGVHVGGDEAGHHAHIDLPGFHLNASGGRASIRMPGVSINADGDDAKVTAGPEGHETSVVSAHPGGTEIRVGGVNANGADMTYLLASDTPGPSGARVVGYMAKGPSAGPLVVGVFRVRDHEHGDNDVNDLGVSRLVDINVHAGTKAG